PTAAAPLSAQHGGEAVLNAPGASQTAQHSIDLQTLRTLINDSVSSAFATINDKLDRNTDSIYHLENLISSMATNHARDTNEFGNQLSYIHESTSMISQSIESLDSRLIQQCDLIMKCKSETAELSSTVQKLNSSISTSFATVSDKINNSNMKTNSDIRYLYKNMTNTPNPHENSHQSTTSPPCTPSHPPTNMKVNPHYTSQTIYNIPGDFPYKQPDGSSLEQTPTTPFTMPALSLPHSNENIKLLKPENAPIYDPYTHIDIQYWTQQVSDFLDQYNATDRQIQTLLPGIFIKQNSNLYSWYASNSRKYTDWPSFREILHRDKGSVDYVSNRVKKFNSLSVHTSRTPANYSDYILEKETLRDQAYGPNVSTLMPDLVFIQQLQQELPPEAKKTFMSYNCKTLGEYKQKSREYFSEFWRDDPVKSARRSRFATKSSVNQDIHNTSHSQQQLQQTSQRSQLNKKMPYPSSRPNYNYNRDPNQVYQHEDEEYDDENEHDESGSEADFGIQ
ncbi:hypothetical protein HDU98_005247, partial [Podochytrium sp. JEL0797]